jgi:hypothetical protein
MATSCTCFPICSHLWMFGTVLENFWGPKRFLTFYLITGLGAALIQTLFTWYELSQLGNEISQYLAAPNLMDFLALMRKNSMYLTSDNLNIINEFLSRWEVMPTDSGLIAQSGELANQLLVYKMNIPTIGASGSGIWYFACFRDAVSKYDALRLFCYSD